MMRYATQPTWWLRWPLVILAVVFVPPVPARSAELPEIKKALTRWRSDLVTLRFSCKTVITQDGVPVQPARSIEEEWDWTDAGQLRTYVAQFQGGVNSYRMIYLWDRERYCTVSYPEGVSETERPLTVTMAPRSTSRHQLMTTPLMGLWYHTHFSWLTDILSQVDVILDKEETHNGIVCPVLIVQTNPNTPYRLVLHPERDYLPIKSRVGFFECLVDDFQQMENGHWFPVRGRFDYHVDDLPEGKAWEIQDLSCNTPLPPSRFEPPMAPGTEVFDWIRNRHTFHGLSERESIERLRARQAASQLEGVHPVKPTPSGPNAPLSATPLTTSYWEYAPLLTALVCAVVALVSYFSRRR